MSLHEFVEEDCRFMTHYHRDDHSHYKRYAAQKPDFDDLFDDGPAYDEVMRYGKKIQEKENGTRIAEVWEYRGIRYGLVWDKETGQNLRYDELNRILQEKEERKKS